MARIFYFSDTGNVYGVHSGAHESNPLIRIPKGVEWVDVGGLPGRIPWPDLPNGDAGSERSTRINLTSKALELKDVADLPKPPRFRDTADGVTTVAGLRAELNLLKRELRGQS